ncbi:MAG: hypothetical protein ACYCYF_04980, partial [Anaerolineae bacterium]
MPAQSSRLWSTRLAAIRNGKSPDMLPAQILETAIEYCGATGGGIYRAQNGDFTTLSYKNLPDAPDLRSALDAAAPDESGLFRSGLLRSGPAAQQDSAPLGVLA